jgi:hypothetical protein
MTTTTTDSPKQAELSREQRFWQLYKLAFTGLHAGFEQIIYDGSIGTSTVYYEGGKEMIQRCQYLAEVAWNSATAACDLFEKEETIRNFNRKIAHNAK